MNGTKRLKALALCLTFTLGGACGDDLLEGEDDTEWCQEVCLVHLEVGVECDVGSGVKKVQCGPDKLNASINCEMGGGYPGEVVPHCSEGGGEDEAGTTTTSTTGWGATWDPLTYVELEPTGVRAIDRELFELVVDEPNLLEEDATVLRTKADGTWFIAYAGELCEALGLEHLDELASLNSKDLSGLAGLVQLHELLLGQQSFELVVVRGNERVLRSYRLK